MAETAGLRDLHTVYRSLLGQERKPGSWVPIQSPPVPAGSVDSAPRVVQGVTAWMKIQDKCHQKQNFGPSFFTITSSKFHRNSEVKAAWITPYPSPTPKPSELRVFQSQADKELMILQRQITMQLKNWSLPASQHSDLQAWPLQMSNPLYPPHNQLPSPHPRHCLYMFPS